MPKGPGSTLLSFACFAAQKDNRFDPYREELLQLGVFAFENKTRFSQALDQRTHKRDAFVNVACHSVDLLSCKCYFRCIICCFRSCTKHFRSITCEFHSCI